MQLECTVLGVLQDAGMILPFVEQEMCTELKLHPSAQ